MPRLAYRDEWPWHRCSCGWIISPEKNPCPGCGEEVDPESIQYLDRFGPMDAIFTLYQGHEYRNVPWEDAYRASL